jgi:hypothetical protein
MRRRFSDVFLGVMTGALMVTAGCRSYSAPVLDVQSAAPGEPSDTARVVRFTISAENSNEVELPLTVVRYRLLLDGQQVFEGVRSPEATLRRLGVQSFVIPAVVPRGEDAPGGPKFYMLEGTLEYITPGSVAQILFDLGVRRPRVSFREEGTLDLAAEPSGPENSRP